MLMPQIFSKKSPRCRPPLHPVKYPTPPSKRHIRRPCFCTFFFSPRPPPPDFPTSYQTFATLPSSSLLHLYKHTPPPSPDPPSLYVRYQTTSRPRCSRTSTNIPALRTRSRPRHVILRLDGSLGLSSLSLYDSTRPTTAPTPTPTIATRPHATRQPHPSSPKALHKYQTPRDVVRR